MLGQHCEHDLVRSAIPQFSVQILSARLATFLAMLCMIGYAPKVTRTDDVGEGIAAIVLELAGDERVAEILVAWLRTIPGVKSAAIISPSLKEKS